MVANASVRNLLGVAFRNLAANRVRLFAGTNFLFHAGAGDRSCFSAWNPAAAADRSAGWFASRSAAARLVAATASARIPFPGTWIADALLNAWALHNFGFGDPIAGAIRNLVSCGDWLADRVADIAIAGFRFGTVTGAIHLSVVGFADWFANCAADVAVAGLEAGFTNRAADIAIASLVAGFANGAADVAVAGLEAGFANRAADVAIAGLVDRLANGIAFITVMSFVNVTCAADGDLLGAMIINRAAAIHCSLLVNGLADRFVAGTTTAFRCAVVCTRCTCGRRTAFVAGTAAVGSFNA